MSIESRHISDLERSGLSISFAEEHGIRSASGEEIEKILKWEFTEKGHLSNGYIIPYPAEKGFLSDFVQVRLDTPHKFKKGDKDKEAKYLCPVGSKNRLYIPFQVRKTLQDVEIPLIITEGSKKTLKANQEGYNCIGLVGVWGFSRNKMLIDDFELIKLKGRRVYIVYDGDKFKNTLVKLAEAHLAGELEKNGAYVSIVDLPQDSKLDDFLKSEGKVKFDELIKNAANFDKFELSRSKVNNIRARKDLKQHEINQLTSELILEDLLANGRLVSDKDDIYYLKEKSHQLIKLDSSKYKHLTEKQYGINASEQEYKYLLESIKTQTVEAASKIKVYKFTHYDNKSGLLYVSKFDGQMHVLDGEKVSLVANGTDGVLFEDKESFEVYEYLGKSVGEGFYEKYIVDGINFSSSEDVKLSPDEQRALWFIYCHSIFFEELQPTKPLMLFLGNKGSGKSTAFRLLLKLLFGGNQDVFSIIRGKEDAFLATVSDESLAVFDNVDTGVKWLNDHLAAIATGVSITMRKLYTTNEKIDFKPRVFIGLTARTPKFRRDDIADRLIILNLDPRKTFTTENNLIRELLEKRNEIYTDLLNNLNRIVKHLKTDKSTLNENFRMADFAELSWKIGNIVGVGDNVIAALKKMKKEQNEFHRNGDLVIEGLEAWLEGSKNDGRWVTVKELYDEINGVGSYIQIMCKSPNSLAQYIRTIVKSIEPIIKTETRRRGVGRALEYKFNRVERDISTEKEK